MIDDTSSPAAHASSAAPAAAVHASRSRQHTLVLAAGLSFGSAIALGLTRFSYALLLPAMKADLGWSFAQAGAMNTANALGYLLGALAFPFISRRWPVGLCFIAGCVLTAALMTIGGLVSDTHALLAQRVITGISSALVFVGGGVLAARLASADPRDAGLVLGLYYGGAGSGIVVAALLVPMTTSTLSMAGSGRGSLWPRLARWRPSLQLAPLAASSAANLRRQFPLHYTLLRHSIQALCLGDVLFSCWPVTRCSAWDISAT